MSLKRQKSSDLTPLNGIKTNLIKMKENTALRSRKLKPFSTIHLQLQSMILIIHMMNTIILILDFPRRVKFWLYGTPKETKIYV
jgi:hypothetical protein